MAALVRVFVSYSNESPDHSSQVLDFTNRLRTDGVDAQIDRYVTSPPEGWPRWIHNQINTAYFVICVCTPAYRKAFEGHNDPERGLGVNAEGYAIMQDLYDRGNVSKKYIPITFDQYGRIEIPVALRAFTYYNIPREYEEMLRRITGRSNLPFTIPGQSSAEPLAAVNEVGYIRQPDISEYIRPDSYPLDRLAPNNGLYVSRLINGFGGKNVMTVWVACRGSLQYVLDSAHIYKHWADGAGPLAEVAIPPDARYRFAYHDRSDDEVALDPALSIGPQTRNFASFTVSTAPSKPIYGLGKLYISIQYHASDGRRGSIQLDHPFVPGVALAKLVGQDILIATHDGGRLIAMVITPDGLQRGLEEGYEPPLQAEFLDPVFGDRSLLRLPSISDADGNITAEQLDELDAVRARCRERLLRRHVLYDVLSVDNRIEELSDYLIEGKIWAADLIGGMATPSATHIIERALASDPNDRAAFYGLCIRHIANPDAKLADFVITNCEILEDYSLEYAACASVLAPAGNLITMFRLLKERGSVRSSGIVTMMLGHLQGDEWDRLVDVVGGPLGDLCVRDSRHWYEPPPSNMRLRYEGNNRYKAALLLSPEKLCFKITDVAHGMNANWGGSHPEATALLDHTFKLSWSRYVVERDEQGKVLAISSAHMSLHQITLDLSAETSAAYYIFELNAGDMLHPTLVISRGQPHGNVERS